MSPFHLQNFLSLLQNMFLGLLQAIIVSDSQSMHVLVKYKDYIGLSSHLILNSNHTSWSVNSSVLLIISFPILIFSQVMFIFCLLSPKY